MPRPLVQNPFFQKPAFRFGVAASVIVSGFAWVTLQGSNSLYGFAINKYIRKPLQENALKDQQDQVSDFSIISNGVKQTVISLWFPHSNQEDEN